LELRFIDPAKPRQHTFKGRKTTTKDQLKIA
jgi:hypothetical protein